MSNSGTSKFWQSPVKTVLFSGFIAGSADIIAAILIYCFLAGNRPVMRLLQGIASAAIKKSAFDGGWATALLGLVFHFLIAYSFALGYFLVFPFIPFLGRQRILSAIVYGLFAWAVMNLGVLPLVFSSRAAFNWHAFISEAPVLMITIGLPVSLITSKYYEARIKS
jgi:hypothetical protein